MTERRQKESPVSAKVTVCTLSTTGNSSGQRTWCAIFLFFYLINVKRDIKRQE